MIFYLQMETSTNFFSRVFKSLYSKSSEIAVETLSTGNSSFQVDISLPALLYVIRHMSSSAAGPDDIPCLEDKYCIGSLARPLLTIFQQSLFQR